MGKDLILEIGTEEIPARFILPLFKEIKQKAKSIFTESRLIFKNIEVFGTMRRIILAVESLNEKQEDIKTKIKGPLKAQALNSDGTFSQVALSFAKAKGVNEKSLFFETVNNVEYLFAYKEEKGKNVSMVLCYIVPKLFSLIHLPISMKWGNGEFSFIRPVHYVFCCYGGKLLKLKLFGIQSNKSIYPHKFLFGNTKKLFKGKTISEYRSFLKKNCVIVDFEERKKIILDSIQKVHADKIDQELLDENANLVELPRVLVGKYQKDFVKNIPKEVIYSVVKKQQKCFPSEKDNSFFIVSDGKSFKDIIAGYQQVVNARLNDAKFFYEEDLKIPINIFIEKTKKISFLEKSGSIFDKTIRIKSLCTFIANELGFDKNDISKLQKASELSKFDLATHLVGEFPDLMGVVGKYYSLKHGIDKEVAMAIEEQYLPNSANSLVPKSLIGSVLGISDRIDNISSCFILGMIPTGSEDPYALRRSAQGIVSLLLGKNLRIPLSKIVKQSISLLDSSKIDIVYSKIMDFILQRFKILLENEGLDKMISESVVTNADILPDAYCKGFIIRNSLKEPWFKQVLIASDRVKRISKNFSGEINPNLFETNEERELYEIYLKTKKEFETYIHKLDFQNSLKVLTTFYDILQTFFEKVLVMHEDEKLRYNRLSLLANISKLFESYADFSKIILTD